MCDGDGAEGVCVCVCGGGGESTKSLTKQLSSPSNAIGNGGCLGGNG